VREDPALTEEHALGDRCVRQHAHRDLGLGEPGHVLDHLDAGGLQFGGRGTSGERGVVPDDPVTGECQMARHGAPHPAETGESDLHDLSSWTLVQRGRAGGGSPAQAARSRDSTPSRVTGRGLA
jgi:hypothetical protein